MRATIAVDPPLQELEKNLFELFDFIFSSFPPIDILHFFPDLDFHQRRFPSRTFIDYGPLLLESLRLGVPLLLLKPLRKLLFGVFHLLVLFVDLFEVLILRHLINNLLFLKEIRGLLH